jgi:hypothetical protein
MRVWTENLTVLYCFFYPFLFLLPGKLLKSLGEGDNTTLDDFSHEEPPPEKGELDEKFSWTKHSMLFWIMDNFLPCVLGASAFRTNFDKGFPTDMWAVVHHSDISFILFVIRKDYDYCRECAEKKNIGAKLDAASRTRKTENIAQYHRVEDEVRGGFTEEVQNAVERAYREHRNEVNMKKLYGGKRKSQDDEDTSISRRRTVGPLEMRFLAAV